MSLRSATAAAGWPVCTSMVARGRIRVEIGFIPICKTSGSPVVIPPSNPPARLVRRRTFPVSGRFGEGSISSCTSAPVRRDASKPSPISTAFTAGIDIMAPARRASSFRSQDTCEPSPTGKPSQMTSQMPPSVLPSRFTVSIFAIIACSASWSSVRSGEASAAALTSLGNGSGRRASIPPRWTTWLAMRTPNSESSRLHTAAAATRAVVSRADARSRISRASVRAYFSRPERSAWPGRTRVTARLRSGREPSVLRAELSSVAAPSGTPLAAAASSSLKEAFMISCQFCQSRL